MSRQQPAAKSNRLPVSSPASVESDEYVTAFADVMASIMEKTPAAIQKGSEEDNLGDNARPGNSES